MLRHKTHKTLKPIVVLVIILILSGIGASITSPVYAGTLCGAGNDPTVKPVLAKPYAVKTAIDFGCTNTGNPISDLAFAIIRLLSDGVGIVVIGSVIVGGIQFSASRSDPQATSAAIGRIRSSLVALLIYIFAFSILNYLIPGGFLHSSGLILHPLTGQIHRIVDYAN